MEQPLTTEDLLPDLPNYDPEPADGVRVGESPVPGLTLKRILRGHTDRITRIAWSPNGLLLASPSDDKTIRIWDVVTGKCVTKLKHHNSTASSVTWYSDNLNIASSYRQGYICIWHIEKNDQPSIILNCKGGMVQDLDLASNGNLLASSNGNHTVDLWDTKNYEKVKTLGAAITLPGNRMTHIKWSPDSKYLLQTVASSSEYPIIWTGTYGFRTIKKIRKGQFLTASWSPNGDIIALSSMADIVIWDFMGMKQTIILQGHSDIVTGISFSKNGAVLASKSLDGTVRVWDTKTWENFAILNNISTTKISGNGLLFHPHLSLLATVGEKDSLICVWDIDISALFNHTPSDSIQYTTAKLVLVGDSGVGKTGLGWRLAHDEFKEHSSTHGQQFWPIPELGKTRDDGTECEAVLWDLAGQHVYRPIHSIFLDNVDASLVLFDPTNRQDPLKGAQFWLEQLKGKDKMPPTILVGARSDRGASTLFQQELDQFCQQQGISGGYLSTSAKEGDGVDALFDKLRELIPWDEMTTTVTTRTFKRVKDFVLSLKEQPERDNVLVNPPKLRQQLQATDPEWNFTDAEMMTAVSHLQTHGYVTILTSSSGDQHILLVPELLATLAASIVLLADKHILELGAVSESDLLQGKHDFGELNGLSEEEQKILLDAAVLRFLEHNICFRENLNGSILLIFPGLIKQKRPLQDDTPATDDISYIVRGRVENIYASLVVLLGYTPSFKRRNQWQNQAQYQTDTGHICGFRLVADREGEIELILYYGDDMPDDDREEFQSLFERFLYQRDVTITPVPPVICSNGHRQERAVVVKRQQSGKTFLFCDECGEKTDLSNLTQATSIGLNATPWLLREEAMAHLRSAYEANLSRIKGFRRDWATPRCYISSLPEQGDTVFRLRSDLGDAGIFFIKEPEQVEENDFVLILSTPEYQKAFSQNSQSLQADKALIKTRWGTNKLISLAIEGGATHSHEIQSCQPGNFTDPTHYAVSLFDLVLDLYHIPLNSSAFQPYRQAIHAQWEQTLMPR